MPDDLDSSSPANRHDESQSLSGNAHHCSESTMRSVFEGADAEYIRASTVGAIMLNMSAVMGQTVLGGAWWATEETYRSMSKPVQEMKYFLSHTWATSRWVKYMQLVLAFNLRSAALISLLVACAGASVMFFGADVVLTFQHGRPPTGLVGYACGSVAYYLILMFWPEIYGRVCAGCSTTMFLDKFCINQVNQAEKEKGISALGAAIKCSKSLVILLTPSYMKRLWTIFELASFIAVHSIDRIAWLPEFVPLLVIGCSIAMNMGSLLYALATANNLDGLPNTFPAEMLVGVLSVIGLTWVSRLLRIWIEKRNGMEHALSNFDIRSAQCTEESDRETVVNLVRVFEEVLGGGEVSLSEEDALDKFNRRVRVDVLKAFLHSFGRTGIRYEHVCAMVWTEVLWMPGELAAMRVQGLSWRSLWIEVFLHSSQTFCVNALTIALLSYLSRYGLWLGRRWYMEMSCCAGCGLTSAVFYAGTRFLMRKLGSAAQMENAGFGVMVLAVGILVVITFSVYRP